MSYLTLLAYLSVAVLLAGLTRYVWVKRRRKLMDIEIEAELPKLVARLRPETRVKLWRPENVGLLNYLARAEGYFVRSMRLQSEHPSPTRAPDREEPPFYGLMTHPETLQWIWFDLCHDLPVNCRSIIYGRPVLVHPSTGVLFAVALGTACALRLPDVEREIALAERGESPENDWEQDVADFGEEWISQTWVLVAEQQQQWGIEKWGNAAYQFAAEPKLTQPD